MTNAAFDLSKLDYVRTRKLRRRRLLLWSALPLALMTILAIWLLLPTTLTVPAIGEYKSGNPEQARKRISVLVLSSPQRFITLYDAGTMDAAAGRYDRAETELVKALALAPEGQKCITVKNLVFALKQRQAAVKADQALTNRLTFSIKNYQKTYSKCFPPSPSGSSGGGSSSQSEALSASQQEALQQKLQKGRERQEQLAKDEKFDETKTTTKRW